MKRLLAFLTIFTALCVSFAAPALAQPPTIDPAAQLSADTAVYLEIRADDAALSTFDPLLTHLSAVVGSTPSNVTFTDLLTGLLPSIDFAADVLPWLGERFVIAAISPTDAGATPGSGVTLVLPIADADGAHAFVESLAPRIVERDVLPNNRMFYFGGIFSMAVSDSVIWLGAPGAVKPVLPGSGETLAQNAAYQQVRAALPADALVTGYLSGAGIAEAVAALSAPASPDSPTPAMIWEAALRLHPAESPQEAALLQFPPLDGAGFAFRASADRLDLTAALSLDANYPAPTLATTTAGAALLGVIPGDSFAVFTSYDVALAALPVAGLAYLGPSIGSVYTSIVASLDGSIPPTPTPTPTPTPAPPLTADALVAQVQPFIAQVESLMGMSLDELYGLVGGEYAVAVFPGAGPTIGAALYLSSPDPQRLLDTIDHVSELILTDPVNHTPLVAVEHMLVSGVNVTLLGVPGADRPALGIVNGNVLFVTMESMVSKVIASAASQTLPTPALDWRAAFGDAQEALFYLDPRTIDLYLMGRQRFPPLPLITVAGSLDARADGLFVLNLTATLSDQ
ncbi:MAG: DUF3352 domain-containing protein [Anaerolineae bacterium]|nr:DUF3352 domain-containing protein [Anaerolineae bacterium]